MKLEAKVGLLFFLALGLLIWFSIFVTGFAASTGAYHIDFRNVAGLDVGSSVQFNGVKIGKVRRVEPMLVAGVPMVRVHFDVEEKFRPAVRLDQETTFEVAQGMLGGATLIIVCRGQGRPIDQAGLDTLVGRDPVTMSDAFRQLNDLVAENREPLKKGIGKLPEMVDNFSGAAGEIKGMVAENRLRIGQTLEAFKAMGGKVALLIEENRTTIASMLKKIEGMAGQIEGAVAENRPDLKKAVAKLPDAVENLSSAAGEVKALVAENRPNLKKTTDALASAAPKLDGVLGDAKTISGQIASGQGTIGKLVMKEDLHDNAMATLDSVKQRAEEIKPMTAGISRLKFFVGLDGGIDPSGDHGGVGTAYLRIEPQPWKFYEAGVTWRTAPSDRDTLKEDPEDLNIDLNLMFGWRFLEDDDKQIYHLSVKGGLIEGALGGQLDVPIWGDRLCSHVMVRAKHDNFDELDRRFEDGDGPMVRATLDWRVWKRVYLYAGATDLADSPAPFIGLRAEILDNDIRNLISAKSVVP